MCPFLVLELRKHHQLICTIPNWSYETLQSVIIKTPGGPGAGQQALCHVKHERIIQS